MIHITVHSPYLLSLENARAGRVYIIIKLNNLIVVITMYTFVILSENQYQG
jgi:hypothetical protein